MLLLRISTALINKSRLWKTALTRSFWSLISVGFDWSRQALEKYNKSLASNKKLRDTIDNLRRERITFEKMSKKFAKDITEQKKDMSDLIEQSNAAYEARYLYRYNYDIVLIMR